LASGVDPYAFIVAVSAHLQPRKRLRLAYNRRFKTFCNPMTLKNSIPRVLAVLFLAFAAPVLAVCALAILLDDPGPILFRHCRLGKRGKPFMILKLRTMKASSAGDAITARSDPRITRIGQYLRRRKLDEVPQLWNIVRGEMAFIGPRPEIAEYVDLADPQWKAVLAVTPGITDLASLAFRDEESLLAVQQNREAFYRGWVLPRKLQLSGHYIETRTLSTDVRLIAHTIYASLLAKHCDRKGIAETFAFRGNI
jgi:lipopolysaccharide/colanic/teichoic acid biosynthesis glycosyltransferase